MRISHQALKHPYSIAAILFSLALSIISYPDIAHARWATREEVNFETTVNLEVNINKDGTYEEIHEYTQLILKEGGREEAANYNFTYNGSSTKIDIIEAKTIYQGKEYSIKPSMIEDKPLASNPAGFDEYRQILLAFPKAEIGATIYLKFKSSHNQVPLAENFSDLYNIAKEDFIKKFDLKIISAIPLKYKINDPNHALEVKESQHSGKQQIHIHLTKPICETLSGENAHNYLLNDKYQSWVSVSSFNFWAEIASKFAPEYDQVISKSLPFSFEQIAAEAAKFQNDVDIINTITSRLNEKVNYMGDWRSIKGKFIPRNLEVIAKTEMGDCKDFSASTAAILRKLGYQAQVAFVMRGTMDLPNLLALPDYDFNHALVKVINKDGKVYWIDPTNIVSMADGIFPDINGKMALVLDPNQPSYEQIPAIDPAHSVQLATHELTPKAEGQFDAKTLIELRGETAYSSAGSELYASRQAIIDELFEAVSGIPLDEESKKGFYLPDLHSRIVRNLNYSLSYDLKHSTIKTNLGPSFPLNPNHEIDNFIYSARDQVSDIYLGMPTTYIKKTIFKNATAKDLKKLNHKVTSPWIEVERSCTNKGKDIEIVETIKILKSFIENHELKTPIYTKTREALMDNFNKVSLLYQPIK
jgi:hypothetical protein